MNRHVWLWGLPFFLLGMAFLNKSPLRKTSFKENSITNVYDAFGKDTSLIKDFGETITY